MRYSSPVIILSLSLIAAPVSAQTGELAHTKLHSEISLTSKKAGNTSRDSSPSTPLLQGEGSSVPPFPSREGWLGGLGLRYPRSVEKAGDAIRMVQQGERLTEKYCLPSWKSVISLSATWYESILPFGR